MKERYTVLKTLFPNYLIIIKKKDHEITFENDKIILNNIKNKKLFNSTNTIILNNLEIVSKKEYENKNSDNEENKDLRLILTGFKKDFMVFTYILYLLVSLRKGVLSIFRWRLENCKSIILRRIKT